jgi:hypothetical protein
MVREHFIGALRTRQLDRDTEYLIKHRGEKKRFFVSDLGYCKLKPFHRINDVKPGYPPDDYLLELFFNGNLWEGEIIKTLAPLQPVTQVDVKDEHFTGRIDAVVTHMGSIPPTVIELKDTADHNFRAKDRLPYLAHCYQVLTYGFMLQRKWGINRKPTLILYYHGRSQWAEFTIAQKEWGILATGNINGKPKEIEFTGADFVMEVGEFESYAKSGTTPEKYESPFAERFACTKAVRDYIWPACPYLDTCWPDLVEFEPPWTADQWWDGEYHEEDEVVQQETD